MINFYVIGGFLGSGKTTTIAKLIERFSKLDKFGIIVNDFSSPLVDQKWLESFNVNVKNIAGGCVCATASSLIEVVEDFEKLGAKNIILEPIGTHLDIANAVYSILSDRANNIIFRPIVVLLDCKRISQILAHSKKEYILEMLELQISSADIIFVNKIDVAKKQDLEIMNDFVSKYDVPVIYGSAINDVGIDQLFKAITGEFSNWNEKLLEKKDLVEWYKKYIRLQRKMVWVNLNFKAEGHYMEITNTMLKGFYAEFSENYLGHLKIVLLGQGGYAKFNLTSWDDNYSMDNKLKLSTGVWQVIVNLRVEIDKKNASDKMNKVIDELSNSGIELLNKELTVPILRWGSIGQ